MKHDLVLTYGPQPMDLGPKRARRAFARAGRSAFVEELAILFRFAYGLL